MTDRLVPNEAAWFCRVVKDAVNWLAALASDVLVWKLAVACEIPRPAELKVTPWSTSEEVRLTLKTTCRLWPARRFTPLNPASAESWSICARTWLYWVASELRVALTLPAAVVPAVRPNWAFSAAVDVPPMVMALAPVASSWRLPLADSSALICRPAAPFTAVMICWTVTLPVEVIVAVEVPSLIVMVLALVTAKDEAVVRPETEPVTRAVLAALCCACWTRAWALCTSLVMDVMPLLAACTVCTAFDTASSRLPRLPAVALSDDAVK